MYTDYDMLDEIRACASKTVSYLEDLLAVSKQNQILYMRMIQQSVRYCELPEKLDCIPGNGLIIIAPCEENALKLIKEMTSEYGHRLHLVDQRNLANAQSEFAGTLNGAKDGDYVFLNYDKYFGLDGIDEQITDAVKNRKLNVSIGHGKNKKNISLDIPPVKLIIYTSIPQLLPMMLKQAISDQIGIDN